MITGFNTNTRHRGRTFHVQTEDSGRAHPHVISHLYHGGTILASDKSEYDDLLESADLSAEVRALMEAQHKSMLDRLQRGDFDALIAERLDGDTSPAHATPDPAPPPPEPAARRAADAPAGAPADRAFGDGIVSQKPLDEVILEYLIDKARGRAREGGDPPARTSRSKG